jgi:hypothetical protein
MASRNNIVKNSLLPLNLSSAAYSDAVDNPQEYLNTLPAEDALRVRAVLAPAYKQAFRTIIYVGAALAALGFVVAFFLMPQFGLERRDDAKLKAEARKEQPKEG